MNPDAGFFVTDTHPLVYYSGRRFSKLSKRARRLYDGAAEDGRVLICVPSIVLAELLWTDVNEMHMLPFKDPFDRMIVGTAKRLHAPLITKDDAITGSHLVDVVW